MHGGKLLLFACGQFGVMALARFFFQWVLHFGDRGGAVGITAASLGVLFFAFRIFDGATDPVAGALSDRWVRSGRRRRSLLWFSFLLPPVGLALVFAPSPSLPASLNWTLMSGGMFVFFVGYTFYAIPYWSLIDDYSRRPDGTASALRTTLSNLLGAGLLVATGVGFVVSPALVEGQGYLVGALWFAVPCSVLMTLPYFAQPADAPPSEPSDDPTSPLESFRVALTHRRFVATIALFAGGQMSFTIMTAAAPFIAEELLGGTLADVPKLLGPFLGAALPFFFLIPRFVRNLGWEHTTLVATVALGGVYACTGALGFALVGTPVQTAMIVFALGGPMAAVLLGLEGEAIIGCASENGGEVTSVYFGVYNLIVKGLNGIALALTGILSTWSTTAGPIAIRAMGFLAGGLLVAGVVLYLAVRPSASSASPSS